MSGRENNAGWGPLRSDFVEGLRGPEPRKAHWRLGAIHRRVFGDLRRPFLQPVQHDLVPTVDKALRERLLPSIGEGRVFAHTGQPLQTNHRPRVAPWPRDVWYTMYQT
jgi:hypothetical protein